MMNTFSTPLGAPLVPKFPIQFRDTVILSVLYKTKEEAIKRILPKPLVPGSNHVLVHFYQMKDPDWFGPHHEFAIQLDAILPKASIRGAYSPYLMLDTDGGLCTGRETYGQPKKLGNPSLEILGDLIVGRAERNSIEVATATLPYKQVSANIEELSNIVPFNTNINYKFVPSITGEPAIQQLTARKFENVVIHECWKGDATLELRANAQFPIHLLPVTECLEGFYWKVDLKLPFGEVIYDYLTKKP